jgi:hypothetical protein
MSFAVIHNTRDFPYQEKWHGGKWQCGPRLAAPQG